MSIVLVLCYNFLHSGPLLESIVYNFLHSVPTSIYCYNFLHSVPTSVLCYTIVNKNIQLHKIFLHSFHVLFSKLLDIVLLENRDFKKQLYCSQKTTNSNLFSTKI